jgi:putative membrane protein
MKRILRHYFIDTLALYAASQIASGVVFEKGIESLLLAGIGLSAASLLARPIINLLLLPINLVTFGFFRWVSSAAALYLVTLIIPGFKIVEFHFYGFSSQWFDIPALEFHGVLVYVAYSFVLSLITSLVYWLIK